MLGYLYTYLTGKMCAHQPPKIDELVEELGNLQWSDVKLMAIHLKIDIPTLDRIEADRVKSSDRLVDFLSIWLKRDTGASWGKLFEALEANNICIITKAVRQRCRKETLSPAAVASSTSHQSRSLPPTPQPTPPLAQADPPMTESSPVNSQGCVTAGDEALPAINSDRIDEVVVGANAVDDHFISILSDTKLHFSKKKQKNFLQKFCYELTTMPVSPRFKDMHFLEEKEAELKQAKDSDKIFYILQPYMSYTKYSLLQHIIDRFGNQKLRKKMNKYISALHKFEKKTTVQDYYHAVKQGSCPKGYSSVEIKRCRDPAICTLYDIRIMKDGIVEISTLMAYATSVESIYPSSVTVTFGFPHVARQLILESITDPQFIKTYQVALITIDGEQIYDGTHMPTKVSVVNALSYEKVAAKSFRDGIYLSFPL